MYNEAMKCRRVIKLLERSTDAVRANVSLVFGGKENRIKERALITLISNQENKLRDAMLRWRSYVDAKKRDEASH